MNDPYSLSFASKYPIPTLFLGAYGRYLRFVGSVLFLWLLAVGANAQIYYIENDNSFSARADQLWKINADGSGQVQVATNFADSPGVIAIDRVSNKAFVAEARVTVTPKVISVDLTTGASTTIASVAGSGCVGIALDPVNQYIYYSVDDGSFTTTNDQIRRVGYNGTGDQLVVTNYVSVAGPITLDLANNRLFAIDSRATASKIVSVNLATNAVTTVINSVSLVTGIAYDSRVNKVYYMVTDQVATTTADELRRVNPDGTGDQVFLGNFAANAPGNIALDKANNLMIVADVRGTAPEILKVNLATATASSIVSLTPTFILRGVAVFPACAAFTATLTPSPSATLTCAQTSLTLTASGGSSYAFARVGGGAGLVSQSTSGSAVVNASGTYSVTATDAEGCTATTTTTIGTNTTQPGANLTVNGPITCTTSSATLTATSTTGQTFVFSSGVTGIGSTGPNSRTAVVTASGPYSVTVTGTNGCSSTATVTVISSTTPTLAVGGTSNPTTCAGSNGSIAFTSTNLPNGVYSLTYTGSGSPKPVTVSSNTFSLTGLSAGTYSNFSISNNGCIGSVTASRTLSDPAAPTLTAGAGTNPSACATATGSIAFTSTNLPNGVYSLTYTGAGSPKNVTVSGNAFSLTGLAAGTYSNFSITSSGCVGSVATSVTLSDPAAPTLTAGAGTNPSACATATGSIAFTTTNLPDGVYSLSYTGAGSPKTVTVSGNAFSLTGLAAGTYSNFSISNNGCVGSVATAVTLNDPAAPTLTAGAGTNPSACATATGSIAFTSTNLPDGVYSLSYTGAGSPKTVTVSGNAFSLTGLSAGTYSNFALISNGCAGSVATAVTLNDPAAPTLTAGAGTNPSACATATGIIAFTSTNLPDGVYSLTYTGSGSPKAVTVSGNAFSLTGLAAGTYSNFSISNNGCVGSVATAVTLNDPAAPTLTAGAGTNPSACATATGSIAFTTTNLPDGVYSLTYTGAGSPKTVTVSGNAFSLTGLAAGTYSNFSLNSSGCVGSVATSVTLNDPAAPTITAGAGTNPSACGTSTGSIAFTSTNLPNGTYSLSYTGSGSPKNVTVSGNAFSLTGLAAGTYSNFSISNNGCVGSVAMSVTLSDPAAPTVSLTNSGPLSCTNTSVTLTATAGLSSYTFNNGANQIGGAAGNTATVTNADVYQVTATDANGCTGSASTTVTSTADSPLAITAQPASASTVVIGATVTVSVSVTGTGPITYQWYKGNLSSPVAGQVNATLTLTNVQLSDAGSYSVVATGPCNSVTSTAFTLTVNEPAPTNQPPTTTGIANQTATVGQAFSLDVASSFSDPNGDALTFNASGLPAGLNLSGSVISGTPSASGVSSVTVTATDPGSLSVSTSFTITVSPASVTTTAPFAITGVTTISCTPVANRINLTFNPRYAGLNGQPISFSVANELSPTTASGPYTLQLYADNPVITLRATQTGTPGEVSFSYNWLAACNGVNPSTNQAPTTTGIANQNATVGQGFNLNVASSFSDPNGDALTFSASGLPSGLNLSGSTISGTPSASGVSTVTVTATDPGSLSVSTSFTITVNPASVVTTPFAITGVTTISCTPVANRINLTFTPQYAGTNGQPISFRVANELSPTTAPGPYSLSLYPDNPVITLRATQTGTPGEVSFSYNWLAACNSVNPPTNQAPTTTGIANQNATVGQGFNLNVASSFSDPNGDALTFSASGLPGGLSLSGSTISGTPSASGVSTVTVTATDPGSLSVSTSFQITVNPASVVNAPFAITAVTTVSCVVVTAGQRQVSFTPQYSGTNGQPISFSVVNELSPTTNPGPYTLTLYTDNPVITLKARQTGTAGEASFSYNWLASCFPGARRGVAESTEPLTVTVLGNPVQDETVRLEVRGAQHQPLRIRITDTGGQVLTDQLTQGQSPVERHTIRLRAQSSGLLLLQVSTPTQSKVIKLIKQ